MRGIVNGTLESNVGAHFQDSVGVRGRPARRSVLWTTTACGSSDGITSDTQLQIVVDPTAAGYEYSLTGVEGSYQAIATPSAFQPAGVVPGFNVVYVRACDAPPATAVRPAAIALGR